MADNRQNLLNDISNGLKGIRTAINSTNVTIPEDTPLENYPDYINEISETRVDIGKQIFIFYTWAKTADEAKNYNKPSIYWNVESGDGWTVEETNNWKLDLPDNPNVSGSESNDTYYTFVMFVSLATTHSSSDEDFTWPTPVQVSGAKGEQGEVGNDGKDGIVAGLILNTNINLYSTSPTVDESKIKYDIAAYDANSSYELTGEYLKYNGQKIEEWSVGSTDTLFLTCPTNVTVYTLTIRVSSDSENVKIIYGPTCQSVTDVEVKYSNDGTTWSNTASVSKENRNLYAKIKTKFGTEETESGAMLISKYPNEIENFSITGYGTSWSTTDVPTTWTPTMPNMNDEECPVLWAKYYVDHLDSANNKEINTPILHRGTAGIPYNLLMAFEEELDVTDETNRPYVWTLNHWSDFSSSSYNAIKAASNVYMYVSGINSSTAVKEHVRIDDDKYLLNLGSFGGGGKSDWNANEGEKGYIANRTHYDIWEDREEEFYVGDSFFIPVSAKDIVCYYTPDIESMEYDTISASDVNEFEDKSIFELTGSDEDLITYSTGDYEGKIVYKLPTGTKTLDPKYVPRMIETTYAELKALKDRSKLTPGMQYRITDYNAITITPNTSASDNCEFDLIVTANSKSQFDYKVRAIWKEGHIVEDHDFDLSKWEIWYDFDNRYNYHWTSAADSEAKWEVLGKDYIETQQVVSALNVNEWYKTLIVPDPPISTPEYNEPYLTLNETSGEMYICEDSSRPYRIHRGNNLFVYQPSSLPVLNTILREESVSYVTISDDNHLLFHNSNGDVVLRTTENTMSAKTYSKSGDDVDVVHLGGVWTDLWMDTKTEQNIMHNILSNPSQQMTVTELVSLSTNSTWKIGWLLQYNEPQNFAVHVAANDMEPTYNVTSYADAVLRGPVCYKGTIYRMIDEYGNDLPYDFINISAGAHCIGREGSNQNNVVKTYDRYLPIIIFQGNGHRNNTFINCNNITLSDDSDSNVINSTFVGCTQCIVTQVKDSTFIRLYNFSTVKNCKGVTVYDYSGKIEDRSYVTITPNS